MRTTIILAGFIVLLATLYGGGNCAAFQEAVGWADVQTEKENAVYISLQKLVQEIVKRNPSAINDYLQAQMSKEQIKAEEGIFEPLVQVSFTRQRVHVPNTTEDILTRQQSDYLEKTDAFEAGVNGIVTTGAKWSLKFLDNRRSSSTIDKFRDYKYEYENSLKLSLEQPVLKGFGRDATNAKIDLAKIQSDVDANKFEQKLMELVGVTIQLYWKLYGAREIAASMKRSLQLAEGALKDLEARVSGGKIPRTELLEAQSIINIKKAELYNAQNKVQEAQGQLMILLNVSVLDNKDITLIPTDNPFGNYYELKDIDEYVRIALEKWPEYQNAKRAVESQRIQLQYAKNQVLPQLDIIGSIGTNSLEDSDKQAFRGTAGSKYLNWLIGIKFSAPLYGDSQARSNLHIAKLRIKQAELELEALKNSLINSLHTKINAVENFQRQLMEYEKGQGIKRQLLETEEVRLKAGRVGMKELFRRSEDYIDYQQKAYSSVVNYKLAKASFEIAVGDLLAKYQIDPQQFYYPKGALSADIHAIFN